MDEKKVQLEILEDEYFHLEIKLRRTKEITFPVTNDLPLFTKIVHGNETITIADNSCWVISTIEKNKSRNWKKIYTLLNSNRSRSW